MSDEYEAAYAEGVRDGESNARVEIQEMREELERGNPTGMIDRFRRAGLPHLDGVTVRWDAASREVVATDGTREVRFS